MALVADGRELRVNPENATVDDFPEFQKMKPEKAEKKLEELRAGAETRAAHNVLPLDREWRDVPWLVAFVVAVIGTLGYGYASSGPLLDEIKHHSHAAVQRAQAQPSLQLDDQLELPSGTVVAGLIAATSCVSLVTAMLFVLLAHRMPGCVVWSSLLFGPAFNVLMGLGLIATGETPMMIAGGILIGVGVMMVTCVFCCWRRLVPFMVKVTEVVADVIEHHFCMLAVAIIGTFLGMLWTVSASISFASILYANRENIDADDQYVRYTIVFVTALLFAWGGGVANNICHVTYCGVFGRWYYGAGAGGSSGSEVEENTLGPSFKAAMTTSLGSICLGSLLVAVVRAMEAVANKMESDARQDGNGVLVIIACLVRCVISCIGDFLEYFNDWAYVQCAVRGVGFCDAARITYSMMTCANVKYILSDLLLNSVVNMGAMLVAVVSALSGAGAGYAMDGTTAAGVGAALGFVIGIISGAAALGIINSGVKTLLVCWAEDPRPLEDSHPEIHQEFEQRLKANFMSAFSK